MNKFAPGFIAGIVLTAIWMNLFGNSVSSETQEIDPPRARAERDTDQDRIIEKNVVKAPTISQPLPSNRRTASIPQETFLPEKGEEVQTKKIVNLSIGRIEILDLEQNLSELRKDVRLFKKNDGWRVQFLNPDNGFARIGFQDDDLLRYEKLQSFKSLLESQELGDRLQTIIDELER